ncbi:hypothetical protein Tco_0949847 [Tanacetum coccineum]
MKEILLIGLNTVKGSSVVNASIPNGDTDLNSRLALLAFIVSNTKDILKRAAVTANIPVVNDGDAPRQHPIKMDDQKPKCVNTINPFHHCLNEVVVPCLALVAAVETVTFDDSVVPDDDQNPSVNLVTEAFVAFYKHCYQEPLL